MNPRPLSRAELKEKKLQDESDHNWHLDLFERAAARGVIAVPSDTAIDFLNGFAALADEARPRRSGGTPVDLEKFQALVSDCDLSERDCNFIAINMLRSPKDDQQVYGKKLIYALSFVGSEMATIRVMKQALVEAKTRPAKLKASEISQMRKHLEEVAQKGENYRAMVLQGKVEYALGKQDAAIRLWTDAMEAAVANAREVAERKARQDSSLLEPGESELQDHEDLDAPWIELSAIHIARREWTRAAWAIEIGCEIDDPMVHYYAASLEKQQTKGEFATSSWLYHITKAAASGHPKAQHELASFYADSFWPYLDDEPPDHLKPTPFDRYPRENVAEQSEGKLSDILRKFFRTQSAKPKEQIENMFEMAAFPYDPVSRMRMALQWLNLSGHSTYAPAILLIAQLQLRETLWADAAIPRAALEMTEERYTYASKADYHAERPIEKAEPEAASEETMPNPFYDPDAAYLTLRQVFYADAALQVRMETVAMQTSHSRRSGRSLFDGEDLDLWMSVPYLMNTSLGPNDRRPQLHAQARAYLVNWQTREMYCDDQKGIMFDDTGPEWVDVGETARQICEEQGWDMYDDQGVLMYRHGLRKNQATAAAGAGGR